MAQHDERVNNAIYGNGFRTNEELERLIGGILATVTIRGGDVNYNGAEFNYNYFWQGGNTTLAGWANLWKNRQLPSIDSSTSGGSGGEDSGTSTTSEGSGLSDCAKKLLQKFFPKLNLDAINVTLGLPTGVPSQTTSEKPIGGMVVGNTIYTTNQSNFEHRYGATWRALEFLAHEITHVDQYRRLGIVGFGIGYAIEGVFQAMITPASRARAASYDVNAFETRAVRNASRIIRQLRREDAATCPIEGGILANVTVN
jgi:hypothetical protein